MKLTELTRAEHVLLLDALHLKLEEIQKYLDACKRTADEVRNGLLVPPPIIEAYERDHRITRQLYDDVKRAAICD